MPPRVLSAASGRSYSAALCFAVRVDPGDRGSDRDRLACDVRQVADNAGARRLDFHHRLARFHVEQDIAVLHAVALGNFPGDDDAGFHVHVDLRQDHFDRRHHAFPSRTRRRVARTMSSSCGTEAFSRTGLYGIGASAPPSRAIGATSAWKTSLSAIIAAISAPMPIVFTPS